MDVASVCGFQSQLIPFLLPVDSVGNNLKLLTGVSSNDSFRLQLVNVLVPV